MLPPRELAQSATGRARTRMSPLGHAARVTHSGSLALVGSSDVATVRSSAGRNVNAPASTTALACTVGISERVSELTIDDTIGHCCLTTMPTSGSLT